jgi:hypothetical protein
MAHFTDSEIAEFLDVDDLGITATYKAGGIGAGTSISVIFANNYVAFSGGTVDVEGTYPVATCRTSDVSSAAHDDTLTIDSIVYTIIGVQPSSTTGTTKLVMNS